MIPSHLPVVGEIVLRTAVIYGVVLLGVRISGKREVGTTWWPSFPARTGVSAG